MELWIRSQDKQQLVKVDNLYLKEITFEKNDSIWKEIYCNNDICVGLYLKERALEVLTEIQNMLYGGLKATNNNQLAGTTSIVYQMPEK